MEERNDRVIRRNLSDKSEFLSKVVRAEQRTYFFDVKATQTEGYYLTITESKKCLDRDGNSFYERHKIFLYDEDFDVFAEGLAQMIKHIRTLDHKKLPHSKAMEHEEHTIHLREKEPVLEEFADINFENLGK